MKKDYSQGVNDIKLIIKDVHLTDEEYAENTSFSMTELRKGFELCKKRF